MIQQQRKGGSVVSHLPTLLSANVTRGATCCAMREGIWCVGYLALPPLIRGHLRDTAGDTFQTDAQAGVVAAVGAALVSGLLSHPFDTVKTCMQGDIERHAFGSATQTAKAILADGGGSAFYRGFLWKVARNVSAIFLLDRFFQVAPPLMFPKQFV